MKNLRIIFGELYNWAYDYESNVIPRTYMLYFLFHGVNIKAVFSVEDLSKFKKGGDLTNIFSETDSDLLDSFEKKLEDKEVAEEICKYCKSVWFKSPDNIDVYNYLGEITRAI